jgi:hypothetical protein
MSDSTPSPPLTSRVPHDISRDHPFDGDDNYPLPIVPDASIGDQTMAATTAGAATAGGCDDDRLKACIVAASESVWGNRDVSRDPPFNGDDNHPLPIVLDASIGDRTTAAMMAGAVTPGGCDDDRLKACIINASEPSPSSPSLVPHGVTLHEIRLAHAPSSSPVHADDAPVANLFCGSRGVSQNKRLSLPRETSGHTPARKKHGGTTRRASSVKAQGAIQEMLATLHVDDESSDLHRPIRHCRPRRRFIRR